MCVANHVCSCVGYLCVVVHSVHLGLLSMIDNFILDCLLYYSLFISRLIVIRYTIDQNLFRFLSYVPCLHSLSPAHECVSVDHNGCFHRT